MYSPEVELRFLEFKKTLETFKAKGVAQNAANVLISLRNLNRAAESLAEKDPLKLSIASLSRQVNSDPKNASLVDRAVLEVSNELNGSSKLLNPFQTLTAILAFLNKHETVLNKQETGVLFSTVRIVNHYLGDFSFSKDLNNQIFTRFRDACTNFASSRTSGELFQKRVSELEFQLNELRVAWFKYYVRSVKRSIIQGGSGHWAGLDYLQKGLSKDLTPIRIAFLIGEENQLALVSLIEQEAKKPKPDIESIKTMLDTLYAWASNLKVGSKTNSPRTLSDYDGDHDKYKEAVGTKSRSSGSTSVFKHPHSARNIFMSLAASGEIPLGTAIALSRRFKKLVRV